MASTGPIRAIEITAEGWISDPLDVLDQAAETALVQMSRRRSITSILAASGVTHRTGFLV